MLDRCNLYKVKDKKWYKTEEKIKKEKKNMKLSYIGNKNLKMQQT